MNDRIIVVITDASVIGHVAGPGAWACYVDGKEFCGPLPGVMGNNVAELWAISEGLKRCPYGARVLLWSDNRMALMWANYTARISPYNPHSPLIITTQLFISSTIEALRLDVVYERIKGHASNRQHNRIDRLARREARIVTDEYYGRA